MANASPVVLVWILTPKANYALLHMQKLTFLQVNFPNPIEHNQHFYTSIAILQLIFFSNG